MTVYAPERLAAGMRGNPSLRLIPLRLTSTFGFDRERGPEGWVEAGLGPTMGVGTIGFLPDVPDIFATAPPHAAIEIHPAEPTPRGLLTGRLPWPPASTAGTATLRAGTSQNAARF